MTTKSGSRTTASVTSVTISPSTGDLDAGAVVTITLTTSQTVTVTGTPTLTLNDGGVATYDAALSTATKLVFVYTVAAGQNTSSLDATAVNLNGGSIDSGAGQAATLSLAGLAQTGPQIDTTTPTVTKVVASPGSGDEGVGKTITLTVDMSEAVKVTGTPTLSLNDGGTATYTGGSGTSALTFSYTVGASDSSVAALAITGVNLNGGSVVNGAGAAATAGAILTTFTGLQIDTSTPAVTKVVASPGTGTEVPGNTITLTLDMSEAVTVTGKPTLTLNDGGTATYTGGSGTNALTFSYTVGSSDSAELALAITGANLNGGSIVNGAGAAANLSGAAATLTGLAIAATATPAVSGVTTAPTVSGVTTSPGSGDEGVGKTITLTVDMSQAVTVTGTPTLSLNDGGTATYTGGSGTSALTFSYTVGASDSSVAALAITGVSLNGGAVVNGAGAAATAGAILTTFTGLQIDTSTPAVTKVVASPGTGTEVPGNTITLTLDMSEAVTVTGKPTLTLNDGGTATYTGGSGTNALTFSYTVGSSDSAESALAITGANLNGGSIVNGAGAAANLSGAATTLTGLAIDPPATPAASSVTTTPATSGVTTAPAVSGVTASPASGDEGVGKTITLTVDMSQTVTVTGKPTLTLNDGGTATYAGGSGTNVLTFSYTVGASDSSVAALAVTAANLNGGAIVNGSGTAANLSGAAATLTGLQIDTLTPAVAKVVASPGTGTEVPGNTITLTLDMNDAVTVTGTPTLTLNDGGTATYIGGSGTNALTFSYTVGASDSTVSALAVTGANLNGGSIVNGAGTAANLSGAVTTLTGLAIDPPSTTTTTTTTAGYVDGSANAPAGTPQLPNLFSGYATRPPWEVAGVNYAVGVPAGMTLKDPLSLTSMAGVSVNTTTHLIEITGNNVTLNGYDFSMEGGWGIYVQGNNAVIQNCNFVAGSAIGNSQYYFISTSSTVNNLTIEDSTFNGNGQQYQNFSGLVSFSGSGTFTVQYNYMENSPQHFVEMNNSGTATLIDQYNVFMNGAFYSGSGSTPHENMTQFTGAGATNNSVIQFNTMI